MRPDLLSEFKKLDAKRHPEIIKTFCRFWGELTEYNQYQLHGKSIMLYRHFGRYYRDPDFREEFPESEIEKFRLFNRPWDPFTIIEKASERELNELF